MTTGPNRNFRSEGMRPPYYERRSEQRSGRIQIWAADLEDF